MNSKKPTSLQEAREAIDRLDEQIVKLLAERNQYIAQIGTFKNSLEEIRAQERIDEVIAHVRSVAIENELSPNLVNDLYITMIDGMIESEIEAFKNAKNF